MLRRTVQINGALYDEHRVTRLDSHIGGSTIGYVRSENSTDGYSVTRSYALDYKDGMTVKNQSLIRQTGEREKGQNHEDRSILYQPLRRTL